MFKRITAFLCTLTIFSACPAMVLANDDITEPVVSVVEEQVEENDSVVDTDIHLLMSEKK